MRLNKFKFNRVKRTRTKKKVVSSYLNFLKNKSPKLIGMHYKFQKLSLMLGYTKERDDTWQAMSPDELMRQQAEWQRLSEIFTPIRLEYNQQHYSKTFHREEEIEQGEIDMSKQRMGFREMMDWANEHSKSDFKNVFIKFSEGVHLGRIINLGNDPEYDNGIDRFFRSMQVHDMGQKQTFWSGLCLDYVMDNKEGIRKYLIQNKKLNKAEGEKIKTNGCVACTTLETLDKEYGLDRKELNNLLRTKTRVIANLMYLRQVLPDPLDDRGMVKQGIPATGLYVWEMSPSGLKKILQSLERYVKLETGEDEIEEEELLGYFDVSTGLNIAIGAEGEGVGKNSREYTFEFKGGKGGAGPLTYRDMPYGKNKSELLTYDPKIIPPHKLYAIEAEKFLTYQQMANKMLFLGDGKLTELGKILQQVGYEIPAFELSDNPLDDNFSQSFADKVLGTAKNKALGINPVKNVHAEKARKRQEEKAEEENEAWDDEEEEKVVAKKSNTKVATKNKTRKVEPEPEEEDEDETGVDEEPEDDPYDFDAGSEDDSEIEDADDVDEDEEETPAMKRKKVADAKFNKAVPPSEDEEEEEVRPKKKTGQKRKFF